MNWPARVLVAIAHLVAVPLAGLILNRPSASLVAGACALGASLILGILACLERTWSLRTMLVIVTLLSAGLSLVTR